MKKFSSIFGFAAMGLFVASPLAFGQAANKTGLDFFESNIRPILVNDCYKCHSSESGKLKGGLSVEFHESLIKGGDSGPAIVPGNPDKSLLIKAVRYQDADLQMPPKGEKLSESQIAALTQWVKMGAPDPRTVGKTSTTAATWSKDRRTHWAFQPIRKQVEPVVRDTNWVANPIDAFILAKLEKNDMKPNPPADRRTLIRRATYDLTGLPPTPEEVQAFLDDRSADAYEKVVDRLLASPQYGERWGRIWLDTARYADSRGEIKQNEDVPIYPYAWTYRDYVVKSFNEDKPFNKFVLEQLAADRISGGSPGSLAALGFLTLGPRFGDNKNDIINDRIDVVCKGLLGLTVTCARCHDHKFDPIPQADYYSLRGIFDSCVEPQNEPVIGPAKMNDAYREFSKKVNDLQLKIVNDEGQMKGRRNDPKNKELRNEENEARRTIARLEMNDPGSPPCATVLYDAKEPKDSPVFLRGEAATKGDVVPRRFLEILSPRKRAPFVSGSGRLELAGNIISTGNPLTPRVIVNRIWLHHFGQGIVSTPDDFGNQSEPPSHPELLDYMALQLMQNGWSIKKLHREIMLSNTYQQSSATNPRYAQSDPLNHLLWRANIRRLDFEEIRDSILQLGGQLDLTMGGPPVQLDLGEGGFSHRRTIYGMVDRRNLPEVYSQFDFANPDLTSGRRYETTVPQQALFMMNNPLVVELARRLVKQPEFQEQTGTEARIKFLYERIYQREPTEIETRLGEDYIEQSPAPEQISDASREELAEQRKPAKAENGKKKGGRAMSMASLGPRQVKPIDTWMKYTHVLLQANEAIFIN